MVLLSNSDRYSLSFMVNDDQTQGYGKLKKENYENEAVW